MRFLGFTHARTLHRIVVGAPARAVGLVHPLLARLSFDVAVLARIALGWFIFVFGFFSLQKLQRCFLFVLFTAVVAAAAVAGGAAEACGTSSDILDLIEFGILATRTPIATLSHRETLQKKKHCSEEEKM
jgi:hypothetical protein